MAEPSPVKPLTLESLMIGAGGCDGTGRRAAAVPLTVTERRGGRFRARGFLRTQRHSDSGETTNRDEEQ